MLKKFFFASIFASFLVACGNEQPADTTVQSGEPQVFGEAITADGAVTLADLVTKLQGADSVQLKVKGTVESVCQVKGSWVRLAISRARTAMWPTFGVSKAPASRLT